MNTFDEIRNALRRKYETGMTQQEIADCSGLSRGHICKLLNGTRDFADVSLGNFLRLFPKAKIQLDPAVEEDDMDSTLLELFHAMTQKEKLNLIVYLSRQTATKSDDLAPAANQKIG